MTVIVGDCVEVMRGMEPASVDAIVTDPPYGLGFMGKQWDALPPGREWAEECLRVLKPGGHLLAFGGTRTYHRLACAIEDAGFEIRDCLAWLYGSGFPKSHDVSKGIDKAAGAERQVQAQSTVVPFGGVTTSCATCGCTRGSQPGNCRCDTRGEPVTADAAAWDGWGTALKPAHEPVVMARKPLVGTVAANVLEFGTGAVNVDGCRIENTPEDRERSNACMSGDRMWRKAGHVGAATFDTGIQPEGAAMNPAGRWPANVLLDPVTAELLDAQTGELHSQDPATRFSADASGGHLFGLRGMSAVYPDKGGASRFFYVAKASTRERNAGLEDRNVHPTVKPVELMRWLVRLVTPPDGVVLDPFTGSGTTGCACALEGFRFVGVERESEYADIARARIAHWTPDQLELAA